MAVTILPTSQMRDKIASVLRQLSETGEPIVITRYSKAEAVLLPIDHYNAMMDLLEDREDELDSVLGRRLQAEREAHAHAEGRDFESFVAELERQRV
jgi:prevent-host-death family protein